MAVGARDKRWMYIGAEGRGWGEGGEERETLGLSKSGGVGQSGRKDKR